MVSRTHQPAGVGLTLGISDVARYGTLRADLLHGTSARDPVALNSEVVFFIVVSLGAAFWPTWNATRGYRRSSLRAS